jgi:hypothetical protein
MNSDPISGKPAANQEGISEALDNLAKKRTVIPIAFALIIIFFFFGFVDFKCNSVKVASLSGFNMVTGTHIKSPSDNLFNADSFNPYNSNRNNARQDPGKKVEPNIWAILAFVVAIGGVAAFYKKIKKESLAGAAAGAIGFISLLLLRFAIKEKVGEQGGGMIQVEINFLFAYWASLFLFFTAGGLSYLRMKQEKLIESSPGDISSAPKPVTPLHVNIITHDKSE